MNCNNFLCFLNMSTLKSYSFCIVEEYLKDIAEIVCLEGGIKNGHSVPAFNIKIDLAIFQTLRTVQKERKI